MDAENRGKIVQRQPLCPDLKFDSTLHPVLHRVYRNRPLLSPAETEPSLKHLIPPDRLSGLNTACALLEEAIRNNDRITIIGDYDADGATSTAVAIQLLRALGAQQVDYRVPDRFTDGYGLSPAIVEQAGATDLLVTVDNGISSLDGVAAAQAAGMKVIITDHHLPGEQLPAADAIVNPNLEHDPFPDKHLAGVGVVFYLMLALRGRLRKQDWFKQQNISEPNMSQVLDLVAVGTVADLVPLSFNNRVLVNQGLKRIRSGHACPGIQALLEVAGKNPATVSSTDIAFAVGPRLNAAGRMSDMSVGISCLLSSQTMQARELATELDTINRERKRLEADMQQQASSILDELLNTRDTDPAAGLCLYHPDWHQGIIGILAGRIKEHRHRPVITFANADDDLIKGSARSISGIHIRDILEAIATAEPDLIVTYGGHAMAAGLTLHKQKLDRFSEKFAAAVADCMTEDMQQQKIYSDGQLHINELNMDTAQALRQGGPWGQAFPEPVFDGEFTLIERRMVGDSHLKMRLKTAQSGRVIDGIAFGILNHRHLDEFAPGSTQRLAYKLDINEWAGKKSIQLLVEHID